MRLLQPSLSWVRVTSAWRTRPKISSKHIEGYGAWDKFKDEVKRRWSWCKQLDLNDNKHKDETKKGQKHFITLKLRTENHMVRHIAWGQKNTVKRVECTQTSHILRNSRLSPQWYKWSVTVVPLTFGALAEPKKSNLCLCSHFFARVLQETLKK